ncbi:MAG TPA: hypothetical protein DIV79_02825 [Opitutae bacterium]|nr:hypothetical protein [Opitutae bacterium]
MPEVPEHDLPERDRKKLENAKLAITRGNSEYTVEICSELLGGQPGCLEVRKLLRRAQRRINAERKKGIGRLLGRLANYSVLLPGYVVLKRQPAKAMAIGEMALSRDVYNIKALSLVARGANLLELNETEAFCLESVCDRYPENFAKLERYCESLIKAGSTEKALKVAEKLNELKPGSGQVQEIVKSASVAHSINKGKWADSEEDFRSKLKDKEESDSLERANRVVVDDGNSELRSRDLIESIHRDPQNVDNYKLLVRIYLRQEKYDDALAWLEKAFALPDAENDAPLRQLRSELRVNRVERELFELKRSSNSGDTTDERIMKLETELLALKLEESRKLVEQFPNDYSQRFKYGSYLLESGDVDSGIQQFQISQRSPSLRLKSLVLLGRCFMAKTLYDLALEQLQQAVEGISVMDDFKKEVLYLLAECYEKLERPEEAIEQYKTIYSNDIGYRDVADKIDRFYRGP